MVFRMMAHLHFQVCCFIFLCLQCIIAVFHMDSNGYCLTDSGIKVTGTSANFDGLLNYTILICNKQYVHCTSVLRRTVVCSISYDQLKDMNPYCSKSSFSYKWIILNEMYSNSSDQTYSYITETVCYCDLFQYKSFIQTVDGYSIATITRNVHVFAFYNVAPWNVTFWYKKQGTRYYVNTGKELRFNTEMKVNTHALLTGCGTYELYVDFSNTFYSCRIIQNHTFNVDHFIEKPAISSCTFDKGKHNIQFTVKDQPENRKINSSSFNIFVNGEQINDKPYPIDVQSSNNGNFMVPYNNTCTVSNISLQSLYCSECHCYKQPARKYCQNHFPDQVVNKHEAQLVIGRIEVAIVCLVLIIGITVLVICCLCWKCCKQSNLTPVGGGVDQVNLLNHDTA